MECAEDGVQRLGVRRLVFQHQHAVLDVVEVLAGFGDEFAEQLRVLREVEIERELFVIGFGNHCGRWRRRWRQRKGIRHRSRAVGTGWASQRLDLRGQFLEPHNVASRERLARFDDAHQSFPRAGAKRLQRSQSGRTRRLVAQIAEQIEDGELPLRRAGLRRARLEAQAADQFGKPVLIVHGGF
jgi:hypothetical protein